ncbi:MAG: Uncharacterized protein G01um10147_836 [Microgenomates group bacterium Gr01-1014_7]|nr:MAG: Uncharacterized protein G01um10147_836 [Microgenomates group bacterium Gr01-1014_7]
MKIDRKKLLFLALFTILGFVTLQMPFNKLAGSNVSFTLFDFFAPIAGAFLGPIAGVGSVLVVEVVNNLVKQTPWTTGAIIRLFPTLFAVYYFAVINKKTVGNTWILIAPFIGIFAFLAHPIGREVPYYTLFWLIPLIAYRFRSNLYMRSLGATFTAHSVGGAAWIWAFNLKASVWQGLIPVVISERLLFAAGIAGSFVIVKHVLNYLAEKKILPRLEHAIS